MSNLKYGLLSLSREKPCQTKRDIFHGWWSILFCENGKFWKPRQIQLKVERHIRMGHTIMPIPLNPRSTHSSVKPLYGLGSKSDEFSKGVNLPEWWVWKGLGRVGLLWRGARGGRRECRAWLLHIDSSTNPMSFQKVWIFQTHQPGEPTMVSRQPTTSLRPSAH
jgi:hypothetical protein